MWLAFFINGQINMELLGEKEECVLEILILMQTMLYIKVRGPDCPRSFWALRVG